MPLVSCLMAAHNAASTITASVQSVLGQTHRDLELIVVDDGSTDATLDTLSAFQSETNDDRIVVLRQQQMGPSAARNRGLAQARGEFVAPIDADDIWLPHKLERQLEAIRRIPRAAVAYGWTDFVNENWEPLYADERATVEGNVFEELLRLNFISCGSNTLMARAAVEQVGGYDETLKAAEDWELHTRLAARHPFAAVPEVVVKYRRSPRSLSSQFWSMERNFLEASDKIFRAAPEEVLYLRTSAKASFYRYLLGRAAESQSTSGKWKAMPRYAAVAAWHDPAGLLKFGWRFWKRRALRGA